MIFKILVLGTVMCIGWRAIAINTQMDFADSNKMINTTETIVNFAPQANSNERGNIRSIQRSRRAELLQVSVREEQALPIILTTQTLPTAPTGLLMTYLQAQFAVHELKEYIMFLWDADGKLVGHTPINAHKPWLPDSVLQEAYGHTTPSEHGKVAMILGNDVIMLLEEKRVPDPPIPMLLYSIPNDKLLVPNFYLIPTAYESTGLNEKFISAVQRELGESFNITYEEYMRRKSVMVWKGGDHGEDTRRDVVEYNDIEFQNAGNKTVWIDASFESQGGSNYTAESMIRDFRYHIDIGGVSGTSWGGLRWKMCGGGLVFKLNSWSQDLWHDTIEPWKHYIPVNDDLGNLREMYDWAQRNPVSAYRIAANGQQKCLETYTKQYSLDLLSKIIDTLPAATKDTMVQARFFLKHHLELFQF